MSLVVSGPMRFLLVIALLASTAACRFGEARFDSTVQDRAFDPAGTVFSYIDAHDADLVFEENPRVVVGCLWIIFDPRSDLNDLEGAALADYSHELKLRDALSLVFDQKSSLETGATFRSVVRGAGERGDGAMVTNIHLSPERLDDRSTYQDIVPLASERTVDVTITAATFADADPVLAGDVSVSYARTSDDPTAVREGRFTGSLTAPIVVERTAEQNLALLEVTDVLGLPLSPRGTP